MNRVDELRARQARCILLRLVANFPGLVQDSQEVSGCDLVEWLSNEIFHCIEVEKDTELRERAENGTPDDYEGAPWNDGLKALREAQAADEERAKVNQKIDRLMGRSNA